MENGSERKHLQLDRSSIRLPTISEDAQSALEQLHGLAYEAAKKMEEMLRSSNTPDNIKIQIILMILDRSYGKPEEMLKIRNDERSQEESGERILAVFDGFREKGSTVETTTLEH